MSKIEAGKYDLTPSIIDGKKIAEECIALVAGQVGGVQVAPNLAIQGDGRIYADELALRKILLNLVGNAVKFTPPGGHITVTLAPLDAGRLVTITDTGIGMDEAGISKALEPFGQAASDARPHGSGLGLTIVTRLVEAHGGRFTIDSAPGCGTAIVIWLPDPPAHHVSHQAVWTPLE
ncbi:MAG: ATP-binding protein [Aliidongia sp.]